MPPADPAGARTARGAIFVYYKVACGRVERLRAAFERAAAAPFPAFPSIRRVELMRRSDAASAGDVPDAAQTWMEIYWLEQWPGSDGKALGPGNAEEELESMRQAIEGRAREAGIVELVEGTRHYEAFDSCA